MASVLPKVILFLFISFICLLINLSVCVVAMSITTQYTNVYTSSSTTGINISEGESTSSVTANNFILATGTSFLPFFDLVNLAILDLDTAFLIFIGIIIFIFGVLKVVLLAIIIMNFLPFFDV